MVFPMKFHFFNSFNHKASLILAYQIKILSEIGSKSKKVILKGHYRPYSEFGHCAFLDSGANVLAQDFALLDFANFRFHSHFR